MDLNVLMKEIVDNWMVVALFLLFLVVTLWAFRPGSRKVHNDIANIPFRYEDKPAPEAEQSAGVKEA